MPHTLRSQRRAIQEVSAPVRSQPPPISPGGLGTKEVQTFKCPLCGLQGRVEPDAVRSHIPSLRAGPYVSYARLQIYGGSLPSPTGKMRDREGYIIWQSPEPLTEEQLNLLKDRAGQVVEILSIPLPAPPELAPVPAPPPVPERPPRPTRPPRAPQEPPAPPAPRPPRVPVAERLEAATRAFRPRILALKERPDLAELGRLEKEITALFDEVLDRAVTARGETKQRLEALGSRLEQSATAFDAASGTLARRSLLAQRFMPAWQAALDAILECCPE